MNFKESVEYLYNLGNEVLAMKLGLENIRTLLAALENPEKKYLKVQIAGTNGKGSVCAFLESICVAAKINVGATTSPHLVSITERIKIGGREIGEADFARHATRIRKTAENLVESGELETVPTYFEQVTAIALSAFAEAKVELAILETGLGGRFDAMTAANAGIVAITPIDYDHQQILGNTLSEIAAEKAAIIRKDTKVVVAEQKAEAMNVISQVCASFGVAPKLTDFGTEIIENENGKFSVNLRTGKAQYENVKLNLRGRHQIANAKVAVLLAEVLQETFKITDENIIYGLQTAEHPGRLELWRNFLFDGAHNTSGAKALREFLDENISQPITLVFGAMKDKDLTGIAEILFPKAANLIFTAPDNPRSMNAEELQKFAPGNYNIEKIYLSENVEDAIETAKKIVSKNDLILVTGSLYLVGEARKYLKIQSEV